MGSSSPGEGLLRAVGGRKLAWVEQNLSLQDWGSETREREKDEAATIQVQKFMNQNFVSNGSFRFKMEATVATDKGVGL